MTDPRLKKMARVLAEYSPVFTLLYRATGFLAVLFALVGLGWILFFTRRRIERISGAIGVWFLLSLAGCFALLDPAGVPG